MELFEEVIRDEEVIDEEVIRDIIKDLIREIRREGTLSITMILGSALGFNKGRVRVNENDRVLVILIESSNTITKFNRRFLHQWQNKITELITQMVRLRKNDPEEYKFLLKRTATIISSLAF